MYLDIYMVDDEPIPSVTLGDATDVESAGELSFSVTLTGPIEASMTYSTADGTAVAGEDYTAATDATLSFGPGVTSNTIRIAVDDDDVVEAATETFSVHLRQTLMGLSISVGNLEATGTIRDDDGAARLSIGDASASEGDGTLSFRVTLGGQSSGSVTVDYATAGATATAGRDYTETSGTLTFASGDIRRTITVPLLDDDKHETAETFSVSLSGAVGATLDDGTGTGTIHDDDESPLMTIHGSEGPETGLLDFVVTLSTAGGVAASVDYVTDQGFPAHDPPAFSLAEAGSDYTHQEGTFTFAPGEISKTIRVRVLEDLVDEPTEAIVITLENPINVQFELRDGSDTCPWSGCNYTACCDCGTILDDDVAGLSIGDASGPEDASHLEFEVSLGAQTENSVTVSYATSDATAMAVADYEAASGSLTFQAGTVLRTIQVSPVDDDRAEPTETFVVELSAPVGATITDAEGTGTITDDDDPAFSVTGGTGVEGDVVAFSVTLAGPGSRSATVSYATSDGTAVAVDDYVAASGTLTFAPGDSSKTVSVSLVDDDRAEPAETFDMTLSSATNATIDTATADGTITDNDDPPEVSIGDAEGAEGEAVAFEVTLGEASGREVTVAFGTSDGTATGGEDYQTVAGILTFAPGDLARTVSVDLKLDGKDEPDETFTVTLSSASNATLGTAAGTGTIEDADEPPTLSVDAASGVEGSTAGFSVILDAASEFEVEVDYATSDGTAVAGEDYEAASGTLTFAPGEKARTVSVPLSDDVEDEPAETFLLRLSMRNATGAVAVVVTGTIVDNDDPPAFSVAGGAGAEGDAVEFSVTLAGSSSRSATVSYATSDGTAVAVDDYVAASGTLTFAPGESGRTVSVSLVDDDRDEPTETFAMTLSSPTNATMDTATADGTVIDNDGAPQLSIVGAAGGEGGVLDFVVTLAGSSEQTVTVSYGTRDGTAGDGGCSDVGARRCADDGIRDAAHRRRRRAGRDVRAATEVADERHAGGGRRSGHDRGHRRAAQSVGRRRRRRGRWDGGIRGDASRFDQPSRVGGVRDVGRLGAVRHRLRAGAGCADVCARRVAPNGTGRAGRRLDRRTGRDVHPRVVLGPERRGRGVVRDRDDHRRRRRNRALDHRWNGHRGRGGRVRRDAGGIERPGGDGFLRDVGRNGGRRRRLRGGVGNADVRAGRVEPDGVRSAGGRRPGRADRDVRDDPVVRGERDHPCGDRQRNDHRQRRRPAVVDPRWVRRRGRRSRLRRGARRLQ